MQLQASPVKQYALAQGLGPVLQPRSLRRQGKYPEEAGAAVDALAGIAPDVMVVAAYGLILPAEVLALPRHGCINIHGSLLPRWRGAAPIHRAIEAGDAETGITLMQMDEGLDTGAMLACEATPIAADDSTGSLHDKLAAQGARMVVQALERLARGETLGATRNPRTGSPMRRRSARKKPAWTCAGRRQCWRASAGLQSVSGRHRADRRHRHQALAGRAEPAPAAPAGTVLAADADGVLIACGGALRVTELQRPGGRRQAAQSFLQGMPLAAGSRCALPDGQV